MDVPLRCNFPKDGYCRNPLRDKAIVTSCSHVFCEDCVTRSGFMRATIDHNRLCPACSTPLPNNHDVVMATMHPCEEFKSTVLAGLDPSTILECAGRALSVWNYQLGQEVAWQAHLAKSLTQKYTTLNNQVQHIVDNANTEIIELQKQLEALTKEKKATESRNAEIARLYEQKSRRCSQLQTLYNGIKARVQGGDMRQAASRDLERTLHEVGAVSRADSFASTPRQGYSRVTSMQGFPGPHHSRSMPVDRNGLEQLHPFQRSGSAAGTSSEHGHGGRGMRPPPARHRDVHMTPAAQGPNGVGMRTSGGRGRQSIPCLGLSTEARMRVEQGGGRQKTFEDFPYQPRV